MPHHDRTLKKHKNDKISTVHTACCFTFSPKVFNVVENNLKIHFQNFLIEYKNVRGKTRNSDGNNGSYVPTYVGHRTAVKQATGDVETLNNGI